jgi:hypothetical protein
MGSRSSKRIINKTVTVDLRSPSGSILKNSASMFANNDSEIRANIIKLLKVRPNTLNIIYEAPQEMETSVLIDFHRD